MKWFLVFLFHALIPLISTAKVREAPSVVPPAFEEKSLREMIFNPTLSNEFKSRYRETFGSIDTGVLSYQEKTYDLTGEKSRPGQKAIQLTEERRQFALYMMKRITEYHVDDFIKTDPAMKPIYETKEALSHVEVELAPSYRLETRYTFGANVMDLILVNPYCESRLALEMDPQAFGPTNVIEQRAIVSRDLNPQLRLSSQTTFIDGITSLELVKRLRANWNTALSTSTFFKGSGASARENRVGLSLSHAF